MKNILRNRKVLYAIAGCVAIFIIVFTLLLSGGDNKDKETTESGLKINNNNRLEVHAKGVNNTQILKTTIVIENETEEEQTYLIEWKDVENTYMTGQDLTYTITGQSEGTRSIGKSQSPILPIIILDAVSIAPGVSHTYEVVVSYAKTEGSLNDANSEFTGYLVVTSR